MQCLSNPLLFNITGRQYSIIHHLRTTEYWTFNSAYVTYTTVAHQPGIKGTNNTSIFCCYMIIKTPVITYTAHRINSINTLVSKNVIIIRPHCKYYVRVDAVYSYPPSSVVCRSVTLVNSAKTAAPIELPFGLRNWVGPGNHVLDGAPDPPIGRGKFLGENGHPIVKYRDTLRSSVQRRLNR